MFYLNSLRFNPSSNKLIAWFHPYTTSVSVPIWQGKAKEI
jgi:hypothetical protein